ncbi:hypothetical protein [Streptomyces sp. GQFP]|uniref:hypothetical protein n=1 Tax=Streptomyces sp. GQFP TaxID=2907545 RepID=UPI001F40D34C|nr:hypothetical protein [Streptomyces sp. GQFP]UIX31287.1 hypothetical protein LUX31_15260 [Streptomyces sp. GQFP]
MNGDDTAGTRRARERELAGLLAAALRAGAGEGERAAIAAFLLARDSGAHKTAPTRRQDDWR